jgi:hypothetical protein
MDGDNVEPIIQVLAEIAFPNQFGQILIGGGHHPHVYFHPVLPSDPSHLVFLQYA